MSSGDKSKTSSQTDGKAAQGKKSEMGMMSYKVGAPQQSQHLIQEMYSLLTALLLVLWLTCVHLLPADVRVRPGELPGSYDRDQQRVHECV